jgi:membrane protein DedA with SNARE-associated domain
VIDSLGAFKYFALFLGSFLEGPVLMVATGFLLRLGHLNSIPTFIMLLMGDLAADFAWYGIGYWGIDRLLGRFGKILCASDEGVKRTGQMFHKYQNKIIFISKMTMGFGAGAAVLMAAGTLKVPLGRFTLYNFLGGSVLTTVLMTLGYLFGDVSFFIGLGLRAGLIVLPILVLLMGVLRTRSTPLKRMMGGGW